MYCKDLLKRHKHSKIVFYCRHDKRFIVSLLTCENCLNKDFKRNKLIKKVTDKQKALDFINDENNFFEDGENWQNVLKIKEILEE